MSTRLRAVALLLTAAAVALLIVVTGGAGARPYTVRALFDNAGYAAPGEQVRIAGAPVGTIVSESVSAGHLAVVNLAVTAPGFTPWHTNATCAIRPQSLIAERYVDCTPGTAAAPVLPLIAAGPGAGTHLLGVDRTSSPIDPDIVASLATEPVRVALSTILDQLGTGLAARGSDLNAVILRADPGLAQTNRVFTLLAGQARTLADLARDARRVLGPLAAARRSLAGFITSGARSAAAAATRQSAIAATIHALPRFLLRLRPLMAELGALAGAGTPALANLGASAGELGQTLTGLVPFASRARTALLALAGAAAASQANLVATDPLAGRLARLGATATAPALTLAHLTHSLSGSGAIPALMALLFNGAGATNGFDADGHYLRTDLQVGSCTGYARSPVPGCSANFPAEPGAGPGAAIRTPALAVAAAAPLRRLLGYLTGTGR